MSQWQDISTAPKDSQFILIFVDGVVDIARWDALHGSSYYPWIDREETSTWRFDLPTHWMPLPPAPEAKP